MLDNTVQLYQVTYSCTMRIAMTDVPVKRRVPMSVRSTQQCRQSRVPDRDAPLNGCLALPLTQWARLGASVGVGLAGNGE